MNPEIENDRQFDENLKTLAGGLRLPDRPSPHIVDRCTATLTSATHQRRWSARGRRMLLAAFGAAASIALLIGFFYQPGGEEQAVAAAVILQKLDDQIQTTPRLDVEINNVTFEEASVDGWIRISRTAIAGDIQATLREDENEWPLEIDIALGLKAEDGWVFVRKLLVPDLKARVLLGFLFPTGSPTLLKLPEDELRLAFDSGPGQFGLEKITAFVQQLIESSEDVGATVSEQPDGALLLTLPIQGEDTLSALRELHVRGFSIGFGASAGMDAEALAEHSRILADSQSQLDEASEAVDNSSGQSSEDDNNKRRATAVAKFHLNVDDSHHSFPVAPHRLHGPDELVGATIKIVYDPAAEQVRSITVENLGTQQGSLSLKIGEGEIDAELLDSARVTDENTRILDFAALERMFHDVHASDDVPAGSGR